VTTFRYGPRVVDLDIVFYGSSILSIEDSPSGPQLGGLAIPHPRTHEREFVLRPIAEYV
jgi:dihydroneopterin aldolase/2-amino-4-hydroxy-6-hydroxymethyldihydropteridine diphosphokinase/dihydropteroate synthase